MLSLSLKVWGLSNMKNAMFMLAVGVIVFVVEALLVKLLWNITFPEMFNAPFLDYWQAMSIMLLSNILFKTHSYKNSKE